MAKINDYLVCKACMTATQANKNPLPESCPACGATDWVLNKDGKPWLFPANDAEFEERLAHVLHGVPLPTESDAS